MRHTYNAAELSWAGSRHGYPSLGDCGPTMGPTLQLGVDIAVPSNDVRVLGVTLTI